MESTSKRDLKIDILRFIAIMGIIIAHSTPNDIIFEIRNFDVTLLVILLGTSFFISNNNKKINYFSYVIKRFNRLVIPTWIFLVVFFSLFFILSLVLNQNYYFSLSQILSSFMLLSGIGYVWVMRVFFIIALVSPLLLNISQKIRNHTIYLSLVIICLFIQLLFLYIYSKSGGVFAKGLEYILLPGLGYSVVAAIGIRLKRLHFKSLIVYTLSFLLIFILFLYLNDFHSTQLDKYPPGIHYLSYGVFCSLFLYIVLHFKPVFKIFDWRIVYFISRNSLWLYFWHIIPVQLIFVFGLDKSIANNFFTRFLFIFIVAFIFTYIHYRLKKKLKRGVIEK